MCWLHNGEWRFLCVSRSLTCSFCVLKMAVRGPVLQFGLFFSHHVQVSVYHEVCRFCALGSFLCSTSFGFSFCILLRFLHPFNICSSEVLEHGSSLLLPNLLLTPLFQSPGFPLLTCKLFSTLSFFLLLRNTDFTRLFSVHGGL